MNKETLKKAMSLQEKIDNVRQALNELNEEGEFSVKKECNSCYDSRYEDVLKEIIKSRLIDEKEKLEKELEEL